MHHSVERSIALWKSQNGPFRENIGRHLQKEIKAYSPADVRPQHRFYIDYTERSCNWH